MGIIEITSPSSLASFVSNNKIALVCYGSEMCSHCISFKSKYEYFAQTNKSIACGHVEVTKVKVKSSSSFGTPTTIIYYGGKPIDKVVGDNYDELVKKVSSLKY